jgi:hypothetical protein
LLDLLSIKDVSRIDFIAFLEMIMGIFEEEKKKEKSKVTKNQSSVTIASFGT